MVVFNLKCMKNKRQNTHKGKYNKCICKHRSVCKQKSILLYNFIQERTILKNRFRYIDQQINNSDVFDRY